MQPLSTEFKLLDTLRPTDFSMQLLSIGFILHSVVISITPLCKYFNRESLSTWIHIVTGPLSTLESLPVIPYCLIPNSNTVGDNPSDDVVDRKCSVLGSHPIIMTRWNGYLALVFCSGATNRGYSVLYNFVFLNLALSECTLQSVLL